MLKFVQALFEQRAEEMEAADKHRAPSECLRREVAEYEQPTRE